MKEQLYKAAYNLAPGPSRTIVLASDDSANNGVALPADFAGRIVRVKAEGGDISVNFGPEGVAVDASATSGATCGWLIEDGKTEHFQLSSTQTHVAHDAVSGTPNLRIGIASPK